jgi:ABC-2 type transport system permease protein
MNATYYIFKRELGSFFATPVGYVFICVFLVLNGVFTYVLGDFYERNQADLSPFFSFQPWLFLFLVPAISMRTWAEERKNGTIELLMTLPVSHFSCVLGKFLAAWIIVGLALCMTFPLWLSLEYLGQPDRGIIVAGYIGAWLMSAAFLALSTCMSAITKNQVTAFILSVVTCFLFVALGSNIVLDLISQFVSAAVLDTLASFSFLVRFEAISKGILSLGDSLYFVSFALVFLLISALIIEHTKAN